MHAMARPVVAFLAFRSHIPGGCMTSHRGAHMPASSDLATLVARARESDAEAFASLVAQAEGVILSGAAMVVGSLGQLQVAARCTVVAMRHGLVDCPATPAAFPIWVEALLLGQLDAIVPRATRPGVPGEDALSRLAAQAGLMAMRQDGPGTLALARTVRMRLGALAAADRVLVDARYRHQQMLEAIGQDLGGDAAMVAQASCRIRAGLHPQGAEDVLSPEEALACEVAVTAKPGAEERQRLMTEVAGDGRWLGILERQVRIHLLLQALLVPVDAERTRRLAGSVGVTPASAYPDLIDQAVQHHALDSQVTFGESKPQAKRRPGSSDHQPSPRMRSTPPRVAHGHTSGSLAPAVQDLEHRQRRAMRLLMLGILGIGLAVLGIMWWSTRAEGPYAPDGGRPAPPVPVAPAAVRPVAVAPAAMPAADAPRLFVCGINLGGEGIAIDGNAWLGGGQAQDHGLTILGRSIYSPDGLEGGAAGLMTMLGTGLTGNGGMVTLRYELTPGWYEMRLWFANPLGFTGEGMRIEAGTESQPLPPSPTGQADRWRQVVMPPMRFAARGQAVTILGMRNGDYLAGMAWHIVGGDARATEPLRIIAPGAGARFDGSSPVTIMAMPGSGSGIQGIALRVTDAEGGRQEPAPGSFRPACGMLWQPERSGTFHLTAVGRRADGTTIDSAPVMITVMGGKGLLQQWWYGIGKGRSVDTLRGDARFPDRPDRETLLTGSLQNPDCGKDPNHGRRILGYLTPPQDGDYRFDLCSNDECEVHVSTDDTPGSMRRVLDCRKYVRDGDWDRYPSQKSPPVAMKAGRRHYIEILHVQNGGDEVLHLGWVLPDGTVERPIPIRYFTPLRLPNR